MAFDNESRLGITGKILAQAKQSGDSQKPRAAFVGYLPVGFPDVDKSIQAMKAICEGSDGLGADLVEIGMPYSDPMMDGPTIQAAATKALERGVRTKDIFTAAEAVASTGKRGVVMTYWNIIERYGVEKFARDLANAGGCGCITPDLTPDEAESWFAASDAYNLDRMFLVSPSSTDERLAKTVAACRGWVYATAVMGVTGARDQAPDLAPKLVSRIRQADPQIPVGVGLGVAGRSQAEIIAGYADAVIVGSVLVKCLLENDANNSNDLTKLRCLATEVALGVRNPIS